MPLRDHFRPPLEDSRSWDELHGAWPTVIVMALNRNLPPRYVAAPRVHLRPHADLLDLLGQADPSLKPEPPPIYAAACRWAREGDARHFRAWTHTLVVGQPLPVLPLWLADDLAVPLELEATYEETCRILRILDAPTTAAQ